jgi:hypothetical protein
MTPYTHLQFHLERHAYKRGQFKGDAPADPSRRGKYYLRVVRDGANLCVTMYNTNLLTITPDNRITVSMRGWWTSTTKKNLNDALTRFIGWGNVGTLRVFSYNQMAIIAKGKMYKFYDGMEFDAEGNVLSPLQCFERKQTDREETAEFRKEVEASGFKEVWPVLFATAEPVLRWGYAVLRWGYDRPPVRKMVTEAHHSHHWADYAAHTKAYHDDHKSAYRAIVQECTRSMTNIVRTDVSVL